MGQVWLEIIDRTKSVNKKENSSISQINFTILSLNLRYAMDFQKAGMNVSKKEMKWFTQEQHVKCWNRNFINWKWNARNTIKKKIGTVAIKDRKTCLMVK